MDNIEFKILKLCKKGYLNVYDIDFLHYCFSNNIIDIFFDDREFFILATFYKNYDMINILNLYI